MKSRYLLVIAFFLFCLFTGDKSLAVSNEIHYPSITPSSFLYPLKRVWEKGIAYIQFSTSRKVNYNQGLLKERLAELKYVAEKKLLSYIEKSSQRFSYQAGITVEDIENLNDEDKKEKVIQDFKEYTKVLGELRDLYEANSSFWMLIQQNIDTLNILSEKIKTP